jgi:hypothetical protein
VLPDGVDGVGVGGVDVGTLDDAVVVGTVEVGGFVAVFTTPPPWPLSSEGVGVGVEGEGVI